MADKETALSIVIRAVDEATAKFKAINAKIMEATKPVGALQNQLSKLGSTKSETSGLIAGFEGFGGAVMAAGGAVVSLIKKVAMIGGVVGGAVVAAGVGLLHLTDEFDDLGDSAQRFGVSVDFLAQMRYAAKKSGAEIENLDAGLKAFSENLGQARAGTGRMAKFVGTVSPALLRQMQAAKGNAQAFYLLADAMAKIQDPAKRAALAQKTVGDSALAPLLAQGSKAIKDLQGKYLGFAGSQEKAAKAGGQVADAMKDLHAVTDGIKAALVEGLGPALETIVRQLSAWFQGHRADIARWADALGKWIPSAVQTVIAWLGKAYDKIAEGYGWVVKNWGPISGFFKELWAEVTTAFQIAWPIIKAQIALINGAVESVKATVDFLRHPFAKQGDAVKEARMAQTDRLGWIGAWLEDRKVDKLGAWGAFVSEGAPGIQAAQQAAAAKQAQHLRDRMDTVRDAIGADERQTLARGTDPRLAGSIGKMVVEPSVPQAAAPSQITVNFANAPKGMRATVAPRSGLDIDLNIGYQLGLSP